MLIPGEVISAIINGNDELMAELREMGIGVYGTGGETADIGDLARTVIVDSTVTCRGVISSSEFRYNPDLKVGDEVEVYIESQENRQGQLVLSHKKARATTSWSRVNEALENNEVITGFVKCRTKGGMIVDVFGIEAFLPGSQIDVKPIRDYDVFVNQDNGIQGR